jgi:hypothetical protein
MTAGIELHFRLHGFTHGAGVTMSEVSKPPADWYPDPEQPNMLRYWDGERWTEQRAPQEKKQQGESDAQQLLMFLSWSRSSGSSC